MKGKNKSYVLFTWELIPAVHMEICSSLANAYSTHGPSEVASHWWGIHLNSSDSLVLSQLGSVLAVSGRDFLHPVSKLELPHNLLPQAQTHEAQAKNLLLPVLDGLHEMFFFCNILGVIFQWWILIPGRQTVWGFLFQNKLKKLY